jgi:oligopeptidase B
MILAPKVARKPHTQEKHGDRREDSYFWLREKENPEVRCYLEAENEYLKKRMRDGAKMEEMLFQELKARIKEKDESVPAPHGPYLYYHRFVESKEYAVYFRRERIENTVEGTPQTEELLLDENIEAKRGGGDYFALGTYNWSRDHKFLAYSVDIDGSESYTTKIRDLETGRDLDEVIRRTASGAVWSKDNRVLFYIKLDETLLPYQIKRHVVGTPVESDKVVHEESDRRFTVDIDASDNEEYIFIDIHGVNTSEVRYLPSSEPLGDFKVLIKRNPGIEYEVSQQGDRFLILTNEDAIDFKVLEAPISNLNEPSSWRTFIRHQPGTFLEGIAAFSGHLVVGLRHEGKRRLRIIDVAGGEEHEIQFPEDIYECELGANHEYETSVVRLRYSSMITPATTYDYDMKDRNLKQRKVQEIPSGYDKSEYETARLMTPSHDGVPVPVSVMYKKSTPLDGSAPAYLIGYGSYGFSYPVRFRRDLFTLADRGFVIGIAHIRGGSDLGRSWYEAGKLKQKKNTFHDFIAAVKGLITAGYTKKGRIAAMGGSAGGMLMGVVANWEPQLFKAVVAHVPFVDCLTTMLDESLPLTAGEYNEWGDPNDKNSYFEIKSYSPYDNVKAQDYPHILVTAGFNDPRVTYWEPAKWVARLRGLRTDDNLLLLRTNMEAGHGGTSGRFEALKEVSLEYAFLLKVFA